MSFLDSIKSGEVPTDEQLEELLGKNEEKQGNTLPKGFDPIKMTFDNVPQETANVDGKIKELRERKEVLKLPRDPLEDKEIGMTAVLNVENIPPERMGKTGDSNTGEVSEEHKNIARWRMDAAKFVMQCNRLFRDK